MQPRRVGRFSHRTPLLFCAPSAEDELVSLKLFEKYADQKISFTDCVSFTLTRKVGLNRVFTFDKHFRWAGVRGRLRVKRVAIVGGGVSGLTTAYLLKKKRPELELTLYEKDAAAGGQGQEQANTAGIRWTGVPDGFLTNVPETVELAKSLGLESELQPASDVAKYRFLYKNGGLAAPASLSTGLFEERTVVAPGQSEGGARAPSGKSGHA